MVMQSLDKTNYSELDRKGDEHDIEDISTVNHEDEDQNENGHSLQSPLRIYQRLVRRTLLCLIAKAALCTLLALALAFLFDRVASSSGFPSGDEVLNSDASDDTKLSSRIDNLSQGDFLKSQQGKETMDELQATLRDHGSLAALQYLDNLTQVNAQVENNCHAIAHTLGKYALKEKGFVGALDNLPGSLMENYLHACNGGFLHAIEVDFILQQDNLTSAVEYVEESLCQLLAPQNTLQKDNRYECEHGIGHAVIKFHQKEQLLETLQEALRSCRDLVVDADACTNGIWMDYFMNDVPLLSSGMDSPDEIMKVCDDFASSQKDMIACYAYGPSYFFSSNPGDWIGSMEFCQSAGLGQYVFSCIDGIGMQVGKEHMDDFRMVEEICRILPAGTDARLGSSCFSSALQYYMLSKGIEYLPIEMCSGLDTFQDKCLKHTSP